MNDPKLILVGVALVLAVVALIKPTWPLCAVSVILICAYLLAKFPHP